MKAFSKFVLFTAICFTTAQVHAQMDDPDPNNGGGTTTGVKCPDMLAMMIGGMHFYQMKDCTSGLMLPDLLAFPPSVEKGCQNATTCNCGSPLTTLSKYADVDARLFVPFGGGSSTHLSTKALETVSAGGKVFRTISVRVKGKKTTGADSELECIALFGLEVDPGTATPNSGTLTENKLSYDGREFTVFIKAPAADDTPN